MTSELPPPTPSARPRLTRPAESKEIAGVAAGIAEHFDLSVGLVRLGFVALCFAGGLGFVLYVLGWLLIPEEGESESIADRAVSGSDGDTNWLGVALAVLVAMVLLGSFDFIEGDLVLAAAVFSVGFLLYRGGRRPRRQAPPHAPETGSRAESSQESPFMEAARAEIAEIGGPAILDELGVSVPDPGSVARSRPGYTTTAPSLLGRLTLATAFVAVGGLAAMDTLGILHPSVSEYLLLVLGVIGLGLLVGSVVGRARWLIIPGLLLVPVVLVTSLVTVPLASSFGEFHVAPDGAESLNDSYVYGGADVTFDLRNMTNLGADDAATIELGAGQLTVVAPPDLNLVVDAEIAAGDFEVTASPGVPAGSDPGDASGVLVDTRLERIVDDGPVVTLLVEVGFGAVRVDLVDG